MSDSRELRALRLGIPIETQPWVRDWALDLLDAFEVALGRSVRVKVRGVETVIPRSEIPDERYIFRSGRWRGVYATFEDGTEMSILTTYDPDALR